MPGCPLPSNSSVGPSACVAATNGTTSSTAALDAASHTAVAPTIGTTFAAAHHSAINATCAAPVPATFQTALAATSGTATAPCGPATSSAAWSCLVGWREWPLERA